MKKDAVHNLRRVFVWQLPVRIYHWLNALVIMVLIVTGFYIGDPLALNSHKDASSQFTMGWIRMIHFIAAYIFLFNFLFRIYWGFAGNKYANWRQFIPTNKNFFKDFWQVLKIDILMMKGKEPLNVGHNPVAGMSYFILFIAFVVQVFTGFGLYAGMSDSFIANLFGWVPALTGGDILLRSIHHWAMWIFILFTVVHVYLVLYHDYVEGRGEVSSMFGGWKFIEEEVFDEAQERKYGKMKMVIPAKEKIEIEKIPEKSPDTDIA
ncbi:MAG: Ni/Fe-hydrogenase, b-type cytochrome subunit [Flavisolibacter sp.]